MLDILPRVGSVHKIFTLRYEFKIFVLRCLLFTLLHLSCPILAIYHSSYLLLNTFMLVTIMFLPNLQHYSFRPAGRHLRVSYFPKGLACSQRASLALHKLRSARLWGCCRCSDWHIFLLTMAAFKRTLAFCLCNLMQVRTVLKPSFGNADTARGWGRNRNPSFNQVPTLRSS